MSSSKNDYDEEAYNNLLKNSRSSSGRIETARLLTHNNYSQFQDNKLTPVRNSRVSSNTAYSKSSLENFDDKEREERRVGKKSKQISERNDVESSEKEEVVSSVSKKSKESTISELSTTNRSLSVRAEKGEELLELSELVQASEKKFDIKHPLYRDGYSLFKLPENLKLPTVDPNKREFNNIFNNAMSSNNDLSPSDDRKRFHSEIFGEDDVVLLEYFDSVCNYLMTKLKGLPSISPVMMSVLGRKAGCACQMCHRDGKDGYFVVIPLTRNYELGVVPGSHVDHHPELGKIEGTVEELCSDTYDMKLLTLEPGYLLLGRRSLVHCGGKSNTRVGKRNKFTDVGLHGHLAYSCLLKDTKEKFGDQVTTYVRFKTVKDYPDF